MLSENANAYLTLETRGIVPLGPLKSFELTSSGTRGGTDFRIYEIKLAKRELELMARNLPGLKVEQYMISAK